MECLRIFPSEMKFFPLLKTLLSFTGTNYSETKDSNVCYAISVKVFASNDNNIF